MPSTSACISCHACTRGCEFLQTYQMTLAQFAKHPERASECCLCNNCYRSCPVDISGAHIAQAHRSTHKIYPRWIPWVAQHYPLKTRHKRPAQRLLFLGCNIPKYFPQTTRALIDLLGQEGVSYRVDCCRRPALEVGADAHLTKLYQSFVDDGIKEIIVACPNCYYTLREARKQMVEQARVTARDQGRSKSSQTSDEPFIPIVTSVYRYLHEINWQPQVMPTQPLPVYIPCPDRDTRDLLHDIERFVPLKPICKDVQCCGLGGQVHHKHPHKLAALQARLSQEFLRHYPLSSGQPCYVYCASCAYACTRSSSMPVSFILSYLLGIDEQVCATPKRTALAFALMH